MSHSSVTAKRHIQILLLLAAFLSGACSHVSGQLPSVGSVNERNPGKGLRILQVYEDGEAARVGMQNMDLLSRVGKIEITDLSSYFRAREFYGEPSKPIPIVFWRGNERMAATVTNSRLGIEMNEYSPVMYKFDSIVERLNSMREIPEYKRTVEFRELYVQPAEQLLVEAKSLIDAAEQEGSLSPTQVLVARIYLIFDDASPEELKKQSDMVAKFIATEPARHVYYTGHNRFFEKKRYRVAMQCFKRHLEVEPDDVSTRLNYGVAAYQLGIWSEAEAAADYVLKDPDSLSEHGSRVAYQVKAMGALGRKDYATSVSLAEKAFDIEATSFDISMVQLAAAQSGDLAKVREASMKFQQRRPEKFEELRFQMDAVEAYALAKNQQLPQARDLVIKWRGKDRVEGRLKNYWEIYPGGDEIVKNWRALSRD